MVTAPASGSGKTVLTCGLLAAFQARGVSTEAFKCGPDYIDPMFHKKILGLPSRNLDLFLQGEQGVRDTLAGQQADLALIEGAMGYYDGLNGTDQASAWHTARTGDLPVILAVRPGGS
ncbi:MAG TPA: cobyrinic acid a,c-diamide synthase, partial [Candidatus Evtepia faecigallinarum]|nr:cobyrinic acid a,c-diamide synthase [Candidatus Evtepia faecigallinarum]